MSTPALSVRNLSVAILGREQASTIVDRISFDMAAGEVLAIVGESGSGKTKTAEAVMGLIPRISWQVKADAVELDGRDLSKLPEAAMRKVRGRQMSMIFQEPRTALDPVFTTGHQLCSVYRRHRGKTRTEAVSASKKMLELVGFADAERIMSSYPHQLSGGMRQRIMVAMAMACKPRVLIADEPTTALDVTTQAQVLSRLVSLASEFGTAILLITHDLGVVAQYCDRALVMHSGRIVEQANIDDLFAHPEHPYTRQLLASVPRIRTG